MALGFNGTSLDNGLDIFPMRTHKFLCESVLHFIAAAVFHSYLACKQTAASQLRGTGIYRFTGKAYRLDRVESGIMVTMLRRKRRCSRLLLSCYLLTVALSVVHATPSATIDPETELVLHSHEVHARRNRSSSNRVRGVGRKQRRNQWLNEEDSSDDNLSLFVDDAGVLRKRPKNDDDVMWYSQDDDQEEYYGERPRGPKLTAPPGYGHSQHSDCSNSQMVNSLLKGIKYDCGCTNAEQVDKVIRGNKKCLSTSATLPTSNKKSGMEASGKHKTKGKQKGCSHAQKIKRLSNGEHIDDDCGCSNTERVNNLLRGSKFCDSKTPSIKSNKTLKSYKSKKYNGSGKKKSGGRSSSKNKKGSKIYLTTELKKNQSCFFVKKNKKKQKTTRKA